MFILIDLTWWGVNPHQVKSKPPVDFTDFEED